MDDQETYGGSSNYQDQAAQAYLAEARAKKRSQGLWATVFGCCGCALLIPFFLAIVGALFL